MTFATMSYAQSWSLVKSILTNQDVYSNQLSEKCKEVLSKYGYETNDEVRLSGNEWTIFCNHKSKDMYVIISWCDKDTYPISVSVEFAVSMDYPNFINHFAASVPKDEFAITKDYDMQNSTWYYHFRAKPNTEMAQYREFSGHTSKIMNGNNPYFKMCASIKY